METLNKLPQDVWRGKVLKFLSLKELVRLDSAVINRALRKQFLENIFGFDYRYCYTFSETADSGKMKWLFMRSILPCSVTFIGVWNDCDPSFESFVSKADDFEFINCSISIEEQWQQFIQKGLKGATQIRFESSALPNVWCLQHCPLLQCLSFEKCSNISDESLARNLAGNEKLSQLAIYTCSPVIVSGIVKAVESCSALRTLIISTEEEVESNIFGDSSPSQRLKELTIQSKCRINSAMLHSIAANAPQLRALFLSGVRVSSLVTDACVEHLVRTCSHIISLTLDNFTAITDTALVSIGNHLPQLQKFKVSGSPLLTDAGIVALAQRCTQLTDLTLTGLTITDAAVLAVGDVCRLLQSLNVSGCSQLTDDAFATLNAATIMSLNVSETQIQGSFVKRFFLETSGRCSLRCFQCYQLRGPLLLEAVSSKTVIHTLGLSGSLLLSADLIELGSRLTTLEIILLSNSFNVTEEVVRTFYQYNQNICLMVCTGCSNVPPRLKEEYKGLYL